MKLKTTIAGMLLLALILTAFPAMSVQLPPRRFYASTVLSWWPNSQDQSLFRKYVRNSKQKGMNAISIDVPWNIERKDGSYDFSALDSRLKYILSQNLSAFVRLNMSTAGGQKPYWLADDMLMANKDGKIFSLPDGTVFPSLAAPVVLKKAEAFARAVALHIKDNYAPFPSGEYPVLAVVPAVNPQMTMDYPTGGEVDYSAAAEADFAEWAKTRYREIGGVNSEWKTSYKDWADLSLEKAPAPARELYYAYTIQRMFDTVASSTRSGNPRLKMALQTRAAWEDPSGRSLLLAQIAKNADWIIVADLPQANHGFTADVARTSAMGKKVATEVEAPMHIDATNARYFNQGVRSFEHGASCLIVSNWDLSNVRNNKSWPFLHDMGRLARIRVSSPKPGVALYLSVWDLINGSARLDDYTQVYDQVTDKGKLPIDILTDPVIAADPQVLSQYKEIYLPANWTIPEKIRKALKPYVTRLKITQPLAAGTLDEFGRQTEPLIGTATASER